MAIFGNKKNKLTKEEQKTANELKELNKFVKDPKSAMLVSDPKDKKTIEEFKSGKIENFTKIKEIKARVDSLSQAFKENKQQVDPSKNAADRAAINQQKRQDAKNVVRGGNNLQGGMVR